MHRRYLQITSPHIYAPFSFFLHPTLRSLQLFCPAKLPFSHDIWKAVHILRFCLCLNTELHSYLHSSVVGGNIPTNLEVRWKGQYYSLDISLYINCYT